MTRLPTRPAADHRRLVADHRPSMPTGWPGAAARTLGGHVTAVEFVHDGRPYRVGLLPCDRPGDPFAPRYGDRADDPDVDFAEVLDRECGGHYAFRYQGGFPGGAALRIRSHSVFVAQETGATGVGADLHLVYEPDVRHGDPPADDAVHWIQVTRYDGVAAVDRGGRANPFHPYGGHTSVDGVPVVNLQASARAGVGSAHRFTAEAFLVRDTGRRDATGRGIVEVFGGVRWGWRAGPCVTPSR
ncbi:hypothetical protein GCM10009557_68720 [Virgisporangium ochraceum]